MYTEERLTKREMKQLRKEEKMAHEEQLKTAKKHTTLMAIGAIILGIAAVGWWWQSAQLPIPESEKSKPVDRILTNDWYLGNINAPVKIVEYSDFECPACKVFAGVDGLLLQRFGDRVGIAYRNFPLREVHPNANIAAQAAEAAGKFGKFWQMAAILFDKQDEWAQSSQPMALFTGYAKQLGIEENAFTPAVNSKEVKALVEADYLSGIMANLTGTPTFFVNGEKMNNLQGPDDLVNRVDLLLQEATGSAQP